MKKFTIERTGDAPTVTLEASHFERGEEVVTFYDEGIEGKSVVIAIFNTYDVEAIYPGVSS